MASPTIIFIRSIGEKTVTVTDVSGTHYLQLYNVAAWCGATTYEHGETWSIAHKALAAADNLCNQLLRDARDL